MSFLILDVGLNKKSALLYIRKPTKHKIKKLEF